MKSTGRQLILHLGLPLLTVFGLTACGQLTEALNDALKNSQDKGQVQPKADTKALVQRDLAEMREAPSRIPTNDARKLRLFTHVFGGESGTDVRAYVDARIQNYFEDADLNGAYFSPPARNTAYSEAPAPTRRVAGDDSSMAPAFGIIPALPFTQEAVTAASNIGAAVFLQGAIDNNTITLVMPALNRNIPVTSTRAGLMLFGPGYSATGETEDGERVEIPSVYRQATLVHEARHSDCSGGVRQADLEVARNSRNILEFVNNYPAMNCGHLHTMCPAWHELKGLPACDRHFWGAYAIGFVFATAKQNENSSEQPNRLLRYMANESASRLLYITNGPNHIVDVEPMLNGRFGLPDMTSSGVLD